MANYVFKTETPEVIVAFAKSVGVALDINRVTRGYGCAWDVYGWTDSLDDTMWEVDSEGLTRHKGQEEGCFWTEWE